MSRFLSSHYYKGWVDAKKQGKNTSCLCLCTFKVINITIIRERTDDTGMNITGASVIKWKRGNTRDWDRLRLYEYNSLGNAGLICETVTSGTDLTLMQECRCWDNPVD
jgi:hypothetical protein